MTRYISMLLNLVLKDLMLCINAQSVILFLLGPVMMIVPDYPVWSAYYYACLVIVLLFSSNAVNRDTAYTSFLPVRKEDIITARLITVTAIEALEACACMAAGIISARYIPACHGTAADVSFYLLQFTSYAFFNFAFLSIYYKKADKCGMPFFAASLLFAGISLLITFPLQHIRSAAGRIVLYTSCAVVWICLTFLSHRICVKRFQKVSL